MKQLRHRVARALIAAALGVPLALLVLPSDAQGLGSTSEYWVGRAAYQVGQYGRALEHWERLLAKEPGNASVRYWIGKAYHQLGRREEAFEHWKPLAAGDDRNVARELSAISSEGAALARLIAALDGAGSNPEALAKLIPELGRFVGRTPDPRHRQRARYLLAVAEERSGDLPGALNQLSPLAESYVALRVPVQERMARLYLAQQRPAEAAALYARLLRDEERPRWYLALLEAQQRAGQAAAAAATRQVLLQRFPESGEADRAMWGIVEAARPAGPARLAAALGAYLERFPSGVRAGAAVDALLALPPGALGAADRFLAGQRALKLGRYATAIRELSASAQRGYRAADSWRLLGEAYRESGDTTKAIQVWQQAKARYPSGRLFLNLGEAYLERRQFGPGLEAFQKVVKGYPDLAGEALWNIARILDRQSKDRDKFKAYQQLYQQFPRSDRATSALWRSFWADYGARRLESAAAKANQFLSTYPDSSLRPAFQFWLARLEMAFRRPERAQQLVNRLVVENPRSYYSLRVQAGVPVSGVDHRPDRPLKPTPNWQLPQVTDEVDGLLGRSQVWPVMATLPRHLQEQLLLHQYDAVAAELGGPKGVAGRWLKGVLYYKIARYNEAIYAAADSSDPALLPLAYPLAFRDTILSYAGTYGLDPLLVAALIREESRFKPTARSYVGATGLMQLMPGTARGLAAGAGIKPGALDLNNPQVNIALGTRYLAANIKSFNGMAFLAVAGYNAGTGAVRGWLGRYPVSDPDEFIENIPYTETRDYVKKVYASYWMYRRVYSGNA